MIFLMKRDGEAESSLAYLNATGRCENELDRINWQTNPKRKRGEPGPRWHFGLVSRCLHVANLEALGQRSQASRFGMNSCPR